MSLQAYFKVEERLHTERSKEDKNNSGDACEDNSSLCGFQEPLLRENPEVEEENTEFREPLTKYVENLDCVIELQDLVSLLNSGKTPDL